MTAMDGRLPHESDYDWASTNMGPDSLFVNNEDSFFPNNDWDTSNGIIFVIGVKALSDNVEYSIMMSGPSKYTREVKELQNIFPDQ